MDEPGIAVISKDDWFVFGEERVKIRVTQPMRMFAARLESHNIDDVDDTHLQVRKALSQHLDRGECFERWNITGASHDNVWFIAVIVAGPGPDAESGGAMFDGRIHVEPLRRRLFAGDNHVHIMAAAQAVIGDRKERIRIGRQIQADDFFFVVHYMIDETRVLMAEAVVVLTPHMRGEQIIERSNRPPPWYVASHLEPHTMAAADFFRSENTTA